MIETKLRLGPLASVFAALARPDLRPVWKEARKPLREDIKSHRKAQSGEDGKWPQRAASTRERMGRRAARRQLLGKLPAGFGTSSDRRRLAMKWHAKWSGSHNEGDVVGRASSRLPKRDFAWVSRSAIELVAGMVAAFVAKLMGGK